MGLENNLALMGITLLILSRSYLLLSDSTFGFLIATWCSLPTIYPMSEIAPCYLHYLLCATFTFLSPFCCPLLVSSPLPTFHFPLLLSTFHLLPTSYISLHNSFQMCCHLLHTFYENQTWSDTMKNGSMSNQNRDLRLRRRGSDTSAGMWFPIQKDCSKVQGTTEQHQLTAIGVWWSMNWSPQIQNQLVVFQNIEPQKWLV